MILNKDVIFAHLRVFERSYRWKLDRLESAIGGSVLNALLQLRQDKSCIAFSGGLDSSLCVAIINDFSEKVPLLTIANSPEHPDAQHAVKVAAHFGWPHDLCIMYPSPEDVAGSNALLGDSMRVDNYWMLMKACAEKGYKNVMCCDVIDELACGYYSHQPDGATFSKHLGDLIPFHLEVLDKCSTYFGLNVILPYGDRRVINALALFSLSELVDDNVRKRPIRDLARKMGVPEEVIERRKYGLVSAFD